MHKFVFEILIYMYWVTCKSETRWVVTTRNSFYKTVTLLHSSEIFQFSAYKMEMRICILLVIITFVELLILGDATDTDENNNDVQDKSASDSSPYQSVYNMDFMKGMNHLNL